MDVNDIKVSLLISFALSQNLSIPLALYAAITKYMGEKTLKFPGENDRPTLSSAGVIHN